MHLGSASDWWGEFGTQSLVQLCKRLVRAGRQLCGEAAGVFLRIGRPEESILFWGSRVWLPIFLKGKTKEEPHLVLCHHLLWQSLVAPLMTSDCLVILARHAGLTARPLVASLMFLSFHSSACCSRKQLCCLTRSMQELLWLGMLGASLDWLLSMHLLLQVLFPLETAPSLGERGVPRDLFFLKWLPWHGPELLRASASG